MDNHSGLFIRRSDALGPKCTEIPYPNIKLADSDFDTHVLKGFAAQAYLRRRWHEIYNLHDGVDEPLRAAYLHHAEEALKNLQFPFTENEPPAKDVVYAKLRAGYWRAWVVTYRPFVRRVLELNGANRRRELTPEDTTLAGLGIKAIIESTRAFHGLEATITNPFETAVEQLGNLVVLLAASVDPTLRNYTSESMLKEFFSWAIGFVRAVAHPTSALQTILSILMGLEHKIIENPGYFGGQKWKTLGISVE
ncbi:hypothetical protein MYCTH_2309396 [Thermothelomyces thermophilus ATCC 42464]|uniref:Uncharacterized protein n=1 Tax=Thermothelomyces thermophilus (strain ATCC 42464 / BCRC 31852 / DSM 1799) TaxID=573729 RepID=G2QI91_THET4|nr:uncharacterized protein MYCTH_2309396 [Thermothelomyces thermophilus ATCC 42464]AEO60280.1 hypothetical protein MYCTH_2309396 [Thermothelomyces thermophilus ATCC 42464]